MRASRTISRLRERERVSEERKKKKSIKYRKCNCQPTSEQMRDTPALFCRRPLPWWSNQFSGIFLFFFCGIFFRPFSCQSMDSAAPATAATSSGGAAASASLSTIVHVCDYPVYGCAVTRRGHLLLAGGGGRGNYGVPNTLVCALSSIPPEPWHPLLPASWSSANDMRDSEA